MPPSLTDRGNVKHFLCIMPATQVVADDLTIRYTTFISIKKLLPFDSLNFTHAKLTIEAKTYNVRRRKLGKGIKR